jgi:peptidoglycan/xylan/chitin deacetylase (PgdA/CDA1 family)
MYHEIKQAGAVSGLDAYLQKRYIVDETIFDRQIAFLSSRNAQGKVVITFDDGYEGNYKLALPILTKYGFKATFFITAGWIGKPFMLTWEQIKGLSSAGMEIGSHTYSHAMLGALPEDKIVFELGRSKEIIEKNIGKEIVSISYPNGSRTPVVDTLAQKAGYRDIYGSRFGYWDQSSAGQAIPRIIVDNDLASFSKIVTQDRFFVLKQKIWQGIKALPLALLGKKLYNKLYLIIFKLKEVK